MIWYMCLSTRLLKNVANKSNETFLISSEFIDGLKKDIARKQ